MEVYWRQNRSVSKRRSGRNPADWYIQALDEVENMHFPHLIFKICLMMERSIIIGLLLLSRMIEITDSGVSNWGFCLWIWIMRIFQDDESDQYFEQWRVLISSRDNGEIIYHPRQIQISNSLSGENSSLGSLPQARRVCTKMILKARGGESNNTISYTGWKLVGVIPYSAFIHGMIDVRYFIIC